MKKAAFSMLMVLWAMGSVHGFGIKDPVSDFAFLEFEPYPDFVGQSPVRSGSRFWRLAGQLSFPAGKVGNSQFFGSFKSTWIDRDILFRDTLKVNKGILRRFWQSGGVIWPGKDGRSNCLLVGVGLNSDFADIGAKDFNTEWIYTHSWKPSPAFSWGIGLDVQQYFGKLQPYPLIFVDWMAGDKTKFKWDADFLEVRRFLTPLLCFTAGVRFNLEFFALRDDADYEYNSMGLETGFQYALGGDIYVRLKYKELAWGRETVGLPDGTRHRRGIDAGRSLRLNFAYGL